MPIMSIILIFSLFIKGMGALLEIANQALITNTMGVSLYGDYAYYINVLEILFWVFFSCIVKCNTFYLSEQGTSISHFKRRFYTRYLFPMVLIGVVSATVFRDVYLAITLVALVLHTRVMDDSSTLMASKHYYSALLGEYSLGRLVLFIGILILKFTGTMSLRFLLVLYLFQYLVILTHFRFAKKELVSDEALMSVAVDGKKAIRFQFSDCAAGMVSQAPVILQHIFVGSFEAGFVSIVVLVRRLVNFITGPTAKIFMPEFSRLYHKNDIEGLRKYYQLIMRVQMAFISILCVPMVGFANVLLNIFSVELMQYVDIFRIVGIIFLFQATLGPSTSLLQMTGMERVDNMIKITTIVVMVGVWWLFRADPMFTLYGLCVQAVLETLTKYFICARWMGRFPVSIVRYAVMWLPVAVVVGTVQLLPIQRNIGWMIVSTALVFILTVAVELIDRDVRRAMKAQIAKLRSRK